jgi:hypothetical protein
VVGDSTSFEANQVRENVGVDKSLILSTKNTLNAWQRESEALISAFRLSPSKYLAGSSHKKEGSLVHYSRIFSFNKGHLLGTSKQMFWRCYVCTLFVFEDGECGQES